jgi:hypothetical protein
VSGSSSGSISGSSGGSGSSSGGEAGTQTAVPIQSCSLNSECAAVLVCALGACRVMCITDADCGSGGMCVTNGMVTVCRTPAENSIPCNTDDCPPPLACASDSRCRNVCSLTSDCNVLGITGEICAAGQNGAYYCADPSDVTNGVIAEAPP